MGALVALLPMCWVWLRNPQASTTRRVQAFRLLDRALNGYDGPKDATRDKVRR